MYTCGSSNICARIFPLLVGRVKVDRFSADAMTNKVGAAEQFRKHIRNATRASRIPFVRPTHEQFLWHRLNYVFYEHFGLDGASFAYPLRSLSRFWRRQNYVFYEPFGFEGASASGLLCHAFASGDVKTTCIHIYIKSYMTNLY